MTLEWDRHRGSGLLLAETGSYSATVEEVSKGGYVLTVQVDVEDEAHGKKLAEQVLALVNGTPRCHACGSTRTFIMAHDTFHDTFEPREGCLDCNTWQTPVRLRSDT